MVEALAAINAVVNIGFGIYNAVQSAKYRKQELELRRQQLQAYKDQLALGERMYNTWERDFGATQKQIGEYYAKLTDDYLRNQYEYANTAASDSILNAYDTQVKAVEKQLSKQGMSNSGASVASRLQLQNALIGNQAQNRWKTEQLKANAANVLMGEKSKWVQSGQGQLAQSTNVMAQAFGNMGNSAGMQALQAGQLSRGYEQQAMQNFGNALGGITAGLSGGLTNSFAPISTASTGMTQGLNSWYSAGAMQPALQGGYQ